MTLPNEQAGKALTRAAQNIREQRERAHTLAQKIAQERQSESQATQEQPDGGQT